MYAEGVARLDKRTKTLVTRLRPGDIAIIDHEDIDRVSAEALLERGVEVVINAEKSISGRYPNVGPLMLAAAGVHLVDNVGPKIFEYLSEGQAIMVSGGQIFRGKTLVAEGTVLTVAAVRQKMEAAREQLGAEIEKFATNTLEYVKQEKELLLDPPEVPETEVDFRGRQALVVVRGYDYKADLIALRAYTREMKPVLIGVDGGADALLKEGHTPDIIVGDMDSVSDKALLCGAELIVHAYPDGRAPGMERVADVGMTARTFPLSGTSEDLALLLAYEKGAELIVAVGTHANLVEFLDKGREGMASTFLCRLRVGPRLVDAKGVNKLYRSSVKPSQLMVLVAAALVAITVIVMLSPIRQTLWLVLMQLQAKIGI
jgi:uncharacterized membrane-anchored protein